MPLRLPAPPPIDSNYNGQLSDGPTSQVPGFMETFSGGRAVLVAVEGTFRLQELIHFQDHRGEFFTLKSKDLF